MIINGQIAIKKLLSIAFVCTALSIMLVHAVVPHLHTDGQILLLENLTEHHDHREPADNWPVEEDFCQLSQPFQPKPQEELIPSLSNVPEPSLLEADYLASLHAFPLLSFLRTEPPPGLETAIGSSAFSLRGPPSV